MKRYALRSIRALLIVSLIDTILRWAYGDVRFVEALISALPLRITLAVIFPIIEDWAVRRVKKPS